MINFNFCSAGCLFWGHLLLLQGIEKLFTCQVCASSHGLLPSVLNMCIRLYRFSTFTRLLEICRSCYCLRLLRFLQGFFIIKRGLICRKRLWYNVLVIINCFD